MIDHLLYALAWASFGLVHSVLARSWSRQMLQRTFGCFHRLIYSGIASVHLLLVLWIGRQVLGDEGSFAIPDLLRGLTLLVSAAGAFLIAVSLLRHDVGHFLGWGQVIDRWQGRTPPTDELIICGMYRWVRHPLYLGTLFFLWGLALSPLGLATATWGTTYILIGARLEERDLISAFGDRYRDYQKRVPMLFPWRRPATGDQAGSGEAR